MKCCQKLQAVIKANTTQPAVQQVAYNGVEYVDLVSPANTIVMVEDQVRKAF